MPDVLDCQAVAFFSVGSIVVDIAVHAFERIKEKTLTPLRTPSRNALYIVGSPSRIGKKHVSKHYIPPRRGCSALEGSTRSATGFLLPIYCIFSDIGSNKKHSVDC